MARKKSEFVKASGTVFEIIQKLSSAVTNLGGSDDDLRKLLSDKKLRRAVAEMLVGESGDITSLAEMIVAGNYDWVNDNITEKNFSIDPSRFTTENTKVFHFDKSMTTAEVERAIRKEGYEPAGLEHLLAYGAENPDEQRKHPIVALGACWVDPGGSRHVPCLSRYGDKRDLDLNWDDPESRWDGVYRFLAVRKSSS